MRDRRALSSFSTLEAVSVRGSDSLVLWAGMVISVSHNILHRTGSEGKNVSQLKKVSPSIKSFFCDSPWC